MASGTAALQLALRLVGVGPGDEVVVPTLTFVATANAALYLGARPVLLDVEPGSWTLDCDLLEEELAAAEHRGRLPAAVVAVDIYGQCADYDRLAAVCARYGVPLVLDSAEALGAEYRGRPAGSGGVLAVLSFNGNKIITTSGGGMLVGDDEELIGRARHLASQARLPVVHYEHAEMGYNYRLSNLLAAVGRAQLASLPARVERRRAINAEYRTLLGDIAGIGFLPDTAYCRPSHWLTVITLPEEGASTVADIVATMEKENIETRPGWKPLHLQPLFATARSRGGQVSEGIFDRALCLPSGSSLSPEDVVRVVDHLRPLLGAG
jgi:dTDP-4-amino-4,6-dideoxygalactose transaminase